MSKVALILYFQEHCAALFFLACSGQIRYNHQLMTEATPTSGERRHRVDAALGMRRIQTTCLVTLTVIAVGIALFLLKPVLVPFVMALFFTYSLLPVIDFLQRYARMPYPLATGVTGVLGLGLIALLGLLIYGSAAQMIGNADQYEQVIRGWIDTGEQWLEDMMGWAGGVLQHFDIKVPERMEQTANTAAATTQSVAPEAVSTSTAAAAAVAPNTQVSATEVNSFAEQAQKAAANTFAWNDFSSIVSNPGEKFSSILSGTLGGLMTLISNGFVVGIFVLFLLIGRATSATADITTAWGRVEQSIKHYIVLKVVISAITGGAQGLTLWFLGVDFAPVFGVLGFLLNFIPNIGPVIATFMPLPVLPLSPEVTWTTGILAIAIPGAIHFISGNVVEPKLMGNSLDLHPVVVLLTLIFFGMIWGIIGMFLATPITAVIKILLEQSEFTRPAAQVLAGRLDALGGSGGRGKDPPGNSTTIAALASRPEPESVTGRDAEVGMEEIRPGGAADASRE